MGKYAFEGMATSGPAMMAAQVTPSDTVALADGVCRSLYIGTGGNISLKTYDGGQMLFKNIPSGSILPVATGMVMSTGTTCADIVALY